MLDLEPDAEAATIAQRTRSWLRAQLPPAWVEAVEAGDEARLRAVLSDASLRADWFVRLGDSGLATPTWPREYGGLGLDAEAAAIVVDELATWRAGRPETDFPGLALAGPTIIAWGTAEQKERYLRPLARGEERWCQLFSEPAAGSDLASLATRAERTDDGSWRITGQKVWSSFAHVSQFGILLARTDRRVPKHRGITYFLLDMSLPGVDVRPLRQLNGEAEFNEVFLDDVIVPDTARLGPVDGGWGVALTTLMQERSGLSGRPAVGPGRSDALIRRAQEIGSWDDPVLRDRLMQLFVAERALQMTTLRAFARAGRGAPGAEGSLRKLAHSTIDEELGRLAVEVEPGGVAARRDDDEAAGAAVHGFLSAKILSIAGGTSEIQRNIIAERWLGLPKDGDPYAGLPFDERPRA